MRSNFIFLFLTFVTYYLAVPLLGGDSQQYQRVIESDSNPDFIIFTNTAPKAQILSFQFRKLSGSYRTEFSAQLKTHTSSEFSYVQKHGITGLYILLDGEIKKHQAMELVEFIDQNAPLEPKTLLRIAELLQIDEESNMTLSFLLQKKGVTSTHPEFVKNLVKKLTVDFFDLDLGRIEIADPEVFLATVEEKASSIKNSERKLEFVYQVFTLIGKNKDDARRDRSNSLALHNLALSLATKITKLSRDTSNPNVQAAYASLCEEAKGTSVELAFDYASKASNLVPQIERNQLAAIIMNNGALTSITPPLDFDINTDAQTVCRLLKELGEQRRRAVNLLALPNALPPAY